MENLIKLRVFRDETTEIFNNIINNVRKFKDKSFIDQIDPFDDKYSEIISDLEIDSLKIFENRFELGKYINEIFNQAFPDRKSKLPFINNPHFWSWMSFIYIGQLTKNFTIRNMMSRNEHYIPAIGIYRKTWSQIPIHYRHSIREPYRIYSQFGEKARIYFNPKDVCFSGNMIETLRSRKATANHPTINDYINIKYDRGDGFAKTGASTKVDPDKGTGKSSTVRLGKIYKRLNQNYCAKEMSHIQIAERVGPGFEI